VTIQIYTQTIHRTIQNNQYIEQHNNLNNTTIRGFERNNSLFKYKFWYSVKIPKHTSIYHGIFIRKLAIVE